MSAGKLPQPHRAIRRGSIVTPPEDIDIALIGFAGFQESDWFLRSVELEINVSREKRDVTLWRPEGLRDGSGFADALKARAKIIMISGHAAPDGQSISGTTEEEWISLARRRLRPSRLAVLRA